MEFKSGAAFKFHITACGNVLRFKKKSAFSVQGIQSALVILDSVDWVLSWLKKCGHHSEEDKQLYELYVCQKYSTKTCYLF